MKRSLVAPLLSLALASLAALGCRERSDAQVKAIRAASESASPSTAKMSTASEGAAELQKPFVVTSLAASEVELFTLLKAEAGKAHAQKLRPFVEFHASWCGPCRDLEKSLEDARMIDAFKGTYIIQLDADEWGPKLTNTGFSAAAIPAFFEIDDDGKPTGRHIDGGAWAENIPANMAPPLRAFFAP